MVSTISQSSVGRQLHELGKKKHSKNKQKNNTENDELCFT